MTNRTFSRTLSMLMVAFLLLVACGTSGQSGQSGQPETEAAPVQEQSPAPTGEMGLPAIPSDVSTQNVEVTVAFPYIPNVQFAPYYVAMEQGYYADEGMQVAFDYMFEDEAVQLLAQDQAQFGFVNGISVLLARQSGIPLVTVATITQKFPVAFVSTTEESLKSVDDLKGKKIGIPGRFGASYYGLLAVLYEQGLKESDLDLYDIGFTQVQMLTEGKVDVAVGYATNEPVQLRALGERVSVLHVSDVYPLASDGIITTRTFLDSNPDIVQAFVRATLRGLADTLANPDEAFAMCLKHIPEAELGDTELQRQVLEESLLYWQGEQPGYSDPDVWEKTYQFLVKSGLLVKGDGESLAEAYTNEFVE